MQKSTFAERFLCIFNSIYLAISEFILTHTYHLTPPALVFKTAKVNIFI